MDETTLLTLLRYDLNRLGAMPDDDYLRTLLRAAKLYLQEYGIKLPDETVGVDIEDFQPLVIGTAAWMYTKRRTGEGPPRYITTLKNTILFRQVGGGGVRNA